MTCEPWEVVAVPFPFTDRPVAKRRPALVLSKRTFQRGGYTVLAMITSSAHSSWPGDTRLTDYQGAGLRVPCIVRLKLFTLDNRLLLRKIGQLAPVDQRRARQNLRKYLV